MADVPVLYQFAYSHFNEKARWALDFKGLPHQRETLLPGPHRAAIAPFAKGTTVPILRIGEAVIEGSDQIIDALEKRCPDPALYPADPADCRRALELQAGFDAGLGPDVRRCAFSVLFEDYDYLVANFGYGLSPDERAEYLDAMPGMVPIFRKLMNVNETEVAASIGRIERELDFIATQARDGYLVGERFSVADLSAAALLSPCIDPPDCCMTKPQPMPDPAVAWQERWAGHPGIDWALAMYREHRSPSAQLLSRV